MDVGTDYWVVVRNMVILGAGLGLTFPCLNLAAQNAVNLNQMGVATSLVQFIRSIGATLFAAILGSVLVNSYSPALMEVLPSQVSTGIPAEHLARINNPQALLDPHAAEAIREMMAQLGPAGDAEIVLGSIKLALSASIHNVFFTAALVMTLACFLTIVMRDVPLRRTFAPEPEPSEKPLVAQPAPAD
jgi:hypothetical protein